MKWRWLRWRLLGICVALASIPQLVLVLEALNNAHKIRQGGQPADVRAADYLIGATFSADTLGTLLIWTVEMAVILYAASLVVAYARFRRLKKAAI